MHARLTRTIGLAQPISQSSNDALRVVLMCEVLVSKANVAPVLLKPDVTPKETVLVPVNAKPSKKLGGRTRARAWDPLIKRRMISQENQGPFR